MRHRNGGRSPAHTKTAHSNTSTGLLLKINTVCSWCQTKRTGDPPLSPLWVYWRISSSSSLHHLFSPSPLTSPFDIMGAGVSHITLLHNIYLRRIREQMTKSNMSVTPSASPSYHIMTKSPDGWWTNRVWVCQKRWQHYTHFLKTGDHKGWNHKR